MSWNTNKTVVKKNEICSETKIKLIPTENNSIKH